MFKRNSTFTEDELNDIKEYRKRKKVNKLKKIKKIWDNSFLNAYIVNRKMVERYNTLVDLISAKLDNQPLFDAFFNYGFKMDDKGVFSKEVLIEISGLTDEEIMTKLNDTNLERIDKILDAYGLLKYMESSFTKIEEGMGYVKVVVFYKPVGYDSLYNGLIAYGERRNIFFKDMTITLSVILSIFILSMIMSWIYVRLWLLNGF